MLNQQYITGFVDGEGTFHIAIYKDPRMKNGIKIIPEFHVSQHVLSKSVLQELVASFGCGYLKANHARSTDATWVYVVRNRDDLLYNIIPFFKRNKLKTAKYHDFELFARIVEMMHEGAHRTQQGLQKILRLAYTMNGKGKHRKKKYA